MHMIKIIFAKFVVWAAVLILSGCTTIYNSATKKNEFIFIDSATEVALGQSVIPELTKQHKISQDKPLLDRVNRVGARIARVSDRQDIEYKFSVLMDKDLNAQTLPGGFIYVNAGLMDIFSDNELAFVIAHEVGHVAARHIAKKIQSHMAYQVILGIAFASLGGNSASAGAQTAIQGADTMYNLLALSYSRKDEYEADRLAVKYAYKSGFDPNASISALERLKGSEGSNWKALKYFRTHPYVDERIQALKSLIPNLAKEGI